MKKSFMYKFLISIIVIFIGTSSFAKEEAPTFVSLSPALTETMFALGAQSMLKGVSTTCTYPKEAQSIEKIGNSYYINIEKILKIKPNYILALDSSEFMLKSFKHFNIIPICFKYPSIKSVHKNILMLGNLTNRTQIAQNLVSESEQKIRFAKRKSPKKILYLIQTTPMITIGNKSFITDVIEKSGNISVTQNINSYYPTISEEFCIAQKPDVIVISFKADTTRIKKLFPKSKIIFTTSEQNNIINRPGVRIHKSVEFFAQL